MFCCSKTGIQVVRCKRNITSNIATPSSLSLSNHEVVFVGLVALARQDDNYQDNFDQTGEQKYISFVLHIEESIYQANKWSEMDDLSFNDGQYTMDTDFDNSKLVKTGKIYSIEELPKSLRTGLKHREVKIRFDLK